MADYPDLEKQLSVLTGYRKEVRIFAEMVGLGPGLRERLKSRGFSDFRYDYKVDDLLIEIQGHGFSHRGSGQQRDWKKCNDAAMLGYRVLYFPADLARKRPDIILETVEECLKFKTR